MALVGRITSSIAHSIRNPLMVIGGFARSILKNTPPSDPKRNFIESIVSEARHLEDVLDEILNYSDSLYPTKDFWNVNQLLESSLRDAKSSFPEKNCTCIIESQEGLPPAYIDFKQLSYCLRSLIISSINGRSEATISVKASGQDGMILICIEDKERTAEQEELDALLTPFAITHDLGSGLGLALCRTMLDKQGIPLVVKAPPEGGITYTITLPTQKEEPK
jgi:hypothetical protein